MKVIHKKDVKPREFEVISSVSMVDTTGDIPLQNQLELMRLAGANLGQIRAYQYDYDIQQLIDSVGGIDNLSLEDIPVVARFKDKTEIFNILKNSSKYMKNRQEELKSTIEKRKAIEKENEYRKSLMNHFKENPEALAEFAKQFNLVKEQKAQQ